MANNDIYRQLVQVQAKTRTRADLKDLFIKKNTFAEQKAMAEDIVHNRRMPVKLREKFREHLDRGDFDRESLEINQKVAAKLEKNTERGLREAIRSGKISKYDPSKDRQATRWRSRQQK